MIKFVNDVDSGSEGGTVTFPFRHSVMEASITWSPDNGTCESEISGMDVVVRCSGLTKGVEYTVTVEGILVVSGQQLPFMFFELLLPMKSSSPPSTSGLWMRDYCIHGNFHRSLIFIGV